MMADVIYDLSRLSTRALNATPNGIDWIDTFLADHFVSRSNRPAHALLFGFRGPRLFSPGAIEVPTRMLDKAWGRDVQAAADAIPKSLIAALSPDREGRTPIRHSGQSPERRLKRMIFIGGSLARYGFRNGDDPVARAPEGAIYLNSSHFPLERPAHVAWLEARPDVRPVFFIHDLLPVAKPELFWSGEPARHARRLELLARRGAAAIVASGVVEDMLNAHLRQFGRSDLPVHRASPPVVPLFGQPVERDVRLAAARYFVVCGTIEPRKNHRLLVEVWRRLVAAMGEDAPRLLIIGKRGWRCDDIVEAMGSPDLRGAVLEANGLSTAAYRILLGHALALLSPSFDEGFGLPLAEALTAGVPAIASDIPAHREQGGQAALYLDPQRLDDWYDAIATTARDSRSRAELAARVGTYVPVNSAGYRERLAAFLDTAAG